MRYTIGSTQKIQEKYLVNLPDPILGIKEPIEANVIRAYCMSGRIPLEIKKFQDAKNFCERHQIPWPKGGIKEILIRCENGAGIIAVVDGLSKMIFITGALMDLTGVKGTIEALASMGDVFYGETVQIGY